MRHIGLTPYPNANSKSSMAWCRIAKWMEKYIPGFRMVTEDEYLDHDYFPHVKSITYVFSGQGLKADDVLTIYQKYPKARRIWLYNEKDLELDSSLRHMYRREGYDIITNIEDRKNKSERLADNIHLLNMNLTAFREEVIPIPFEDRKYDLVYWGTWKPGRVDYLKEYIKNCYVSTSAANIPSFRMFCDNVTFIDRLTWGRQQGTLGNFRFTIYIEDKQTHELYNHLSDRFYEAMSFDVIQFIDINAKNNVDKSGYNIDPWFYVSNRKELEEKMDYAKRNPLEIMQKQKLLKSVVLQEIEDLKTSFRNLYS